MNRCVPDILCRSGKLILLAICLTFPQKTVKAQSGYREGFIVKTNGDTLTGWVFCTLDSRFRQHCRFKRFGIAPEIVYKPGEIKGFGFRQGRYFESLTEAGHPRFYECLVKGPVSRYLLPGKGTGHIFEKPDTSGKTKTVVYPATPAVGIWSDLSVTRTSPLWKVGLTAGYQFLQVRIPSSGLTRYFNEGKYDASYRPVAGLSLSRKISRKSELASIHLSVLYLSDSYYGYDAYKTLADCRDEVFIRFKGLQLPLSLQFNLNARQIKPFIRAGFFGTFMLQTDYYRFSERQFGEEIFIDYYHDFSPGNEFGYFGSLGLELHTGDVRIITLEASCMQGSQSLNYTKSVYSEPLNARIRSSVWSILLSVNL